MLKYEQGTYVKHKRRPEWGIGVVDALDAPMLRIRFENETEAKRFRLDTADELFEIVPDDAVPIDSPIRSRHSSKSQRSTSSQAGGGLCRVCNGKLNRSAYDQGRRWKSCPRCSTLHGSEHIYRPYPDAFGTTEKRESDENPDGTQSYCSTCRQQQEPSLEGRDVRLCSAIQSLANDSSSSGR